MIAEHTQRRLLEQAQRDEKCHPDQNDDCVDLASEDSFPASDPPSFTPLVARPPAQAEMV